MSGLSTHVLDTARGRPAAGVPVVLAREEAGAFVELARAATDSDGRVRALLPTGSVLQRGRYRLEFTVRAVMPDAFYPSVIVDFEIREPEQHHHVPLLLAPFGYSTYRGS